jgi:hypothetical protein
MNPTRLFCVLLPILFLGCSRHNDPPNNGGGTTPPVPPVSQLPAAEMLHAQIIGVANTPAGGAYSDAQIAFPFTFTYWPFKGSNFSVDTLTSDKYFTALTLNTGTDVERNKTISLSSATLNYVRIKPLGLNDFGSWVNGTGGTFGNAATGMLTLPPNAIASTPVGSLPGYYIPDLRANIKIGYLSPLSPEFGISSPGYPVADMEGRWYLSSVGIMDVSIGTPELYNPVYEFYSTHTGTLKMPIAPGMTAPDSIPFWHLTAGKWTRSGVAHKSGDGYIATIHEYGAFNFASPVKGGYTTLKFRTGDNIPLINATFRIKTDNRVLFEGQTDWEGNALVFLPSGILAGLEIQYAGAGTPGSVIPAGEINTAAPAATLTVNVQSPSLISTLSGKANNCDGSPIKNGRVIAKNVYLNEIWHWPVVNGTFSAAIVDGSYAPMIYTLQAVDNDTHVAGTDTAVSFAAGTATTYVLNTCPAITSLYMKYSVDGVPQTISGDRSNPQSPLLEAYPTQDQQTFITSGSSVKGLQFSTYGFSPGVRTGSGILSLIIDGKYYYYNPGKPMRVTFDRYDLLPDGLIIGSADFYYDDSSGVTHHVQCSFQVVRVATV